MCKVILQVMLVVLVAVHFAIVLGNVAAFFALPFMVPWYIALPLCTWIWTLGTTANFTCRLTEWENRLRNKLELPEIRTFIGHYFMKRVYRLIGRKKSAAPEN